MLLYKKNIFSMVVKLYKKLIKYPHALDGDKSRNILMNVNGANKGVDAR